MRARRRKDYARGTATSPARRLQENLALRVAGEAQALDVEVDKLHDGEVEEALQQLRFEHTQILAGCNTIRDLRRRLS
jgi:hypothetical protein